MTNKASILLLTCIFAAFTGIAQAPKEPTRWTFEAVKKSESNYELVAHCLIAKGWHIFSQKPGGDGTLKPTSITFSKNINANYIGPVKELGKLVALTIENLKATANAYEGRVDFVQHATISGSGKIFAKLTYQASNGKTILPPIEKEVIFEVK
jgi:hypothetical protein